ncbi:MAG: hypothetical protein K1X79_01760 [Oligoflexia bacterium]|nr:hypothetical protein [Oligoflexia bacterium]
MRQSQELQSAAAQIARTEAFEFVPIQKLLAHDTSQPPDECLRAANALASGITRGLQEGRIEIRTAIALANEVGTAIHTLDGRAWQELRKFPSAAETYRAGFIALSKELLVRSTDSAVLPDSAACASGLLDAVLIRDYEARTAEFVEVTSLDTSAKS